MIRQQSGFTLIELIAVLVILGILAATAIPRFVDLSGAAETAVVNATAGSIESSSSLNYAVAVANTAGLTADTAQTVNACSLAVVNSLLTQPLAAAEYSVTGTYAASPTLGTPSTCNLNRVGGTETAPFVLLHVPAPAP